MYIEVPYPYDVRVIQFRRRTCFQEEAVFESLVQIRSPIHDFDCSASLQIGVVAEIHGTHSAFAELALNDVPANGLLRVFQMPNRR